MAGKRKPRKKSLRKKLRDLIKPKKNEKTKEKTAKDKMREKALAMETVRVDKLKAELKSVMILDDSTFDLSSTTPRYIISLKFLQAWLGYTMYDNGIRTEFCDNIALLNYSTKLKKFTGKEKLLLNVHYRHVNQATWNTFERYYPKSGPTIKCQMGAVEDNASWSVVNLRTAKKMYKQAAVDAKLAAKKQSRRERKSNGMGSFSKSNTLKASYVDESGCFFNVDVRDVLDLVLELSEALEVKEGGAGGDHVVSKIWVEAYIKFALGVNLRFPDIASNKDLLQEEDSIIGKTWKRKAGLRSGIDYVLLDRETWKTVCDFLPGSGPQILESEESWKIDENFMLRAHMGSVAVPIDSLRKHADSAAVTFFTNPLKRKQIEEKEELDRKLQEAQKEAETMALVGGALGRGVENRRKSIAEECKFKHDELLQKEAAMVFSMGERNRVRSVTGRIREREGASEEEAREEAAAELQVWWRVMWIRTQKDRARREKEVAYEHWAVTKLQSVWKARKAKARAVGLKKEREKLKEEMSALKVEAMFRTHLAKKAMKKRMQDKELEGAAGMITRVWRGKTARREIQLKGDATIKLSKAIRRIMDKRKVNGCRRLLDSVPMKIKIYNCIGVGGGDGKEDDGGRGSMRMSLTGGRMSSLIKKSPLGKKGGPPDPRVYVSGFGGQEMNALCLTKTSAKRKTFNPIFNETLVVCGKGLGGTGVLSMTVLDHDKISTHRRVEENAGMRGAAAFANPFAHYRFVGQAVVDMKSILPDWYFATDNKKSVLCENVTLKGYKLHIPEYDGKGSVKLGNIDKEGSGKMTVEFLPLSPSNSHCGYCRISGLSSGFSVGLGGGAGGGDNWEDRWVVLLGGRLNVHQSPWRLNDINFSVKGVDVESWEVKEVKVERWGETGVEDGKEDEEDDASVEGEGAGVKKTIREITVKLRSRKTPYKIRTDNELFAFKMDREFRAASKNKL